ncbi:MAG: hypothetical protein F6K19_33275 [Cyanothece sp. SIO1E1]|nr:hypothetical protein [Cyanothece sp. SIO1E1]
MTKQFRIEGQREFVRKGFMSVMLVVTTATLLRLGLAPKQSAPAYSLVNYSQGVSSLLRFIVEQ